MLFHPLDEVFADVVFFLHLLYVLTCNQSNESSDVDVSRLNNHAVQQKSVCVCFFLMLCKMFFNARMLLHSSHGLSVELKIMKSKGSQHSQGAV